MFFLVFKIFILSIYKVVFKGSKVVLMTMSMNFGFGTVQTETYKCCPEKSCSEMTSQLCYIIFIALVHHCTKGNFLRSFKMFSMTYECADT